MSLNLPSGSLSSPFCYPVQPFLVWYDWFFFPSPFQRSLVTFPSHFCHCTFKTSWDLLLWQLMVLVCHLQIPLGVNPSVPLHSRMLLPFSSSELPASCHLCVFCQLFTPAAVPVPSTWDRINGSLFTNVTLSAWVSVRQEVDLFTQSFQVLLPWKYLIHSLSSLHI